MTYNPRKAAQTVAFFALNSDEKQLNKLKAIKLVYLADRASIAAYGYPIQDEQRVSMKHGPVNSITYDFLKGEVRDAEKVDWLQILSAVKDDEVALVDSNLSVDDLDELSDADIDVLSETWSRFGGYSNWELVDWTHDAKNLPEWEEGKNSKPIPLKNIMRAVGLKHPIRQARVVDDQHSIDQVFEKLS